MATSTAKGVFHVLHVAGTGCVAHGPLHTLSRRAAGGQPTLQSAATSGDLDALRKCLDSATPSQAQLQRAFTAACMAGQSAAVQALLDVPGPPSVDPTRTSKVQRSGFCWACLRGHTEVVRLLLALDGAREVDVHAADALGRGAPLRLACMGGHIQVLRMLLACTGHRRVDVHAEDTGGAESAFRKACEWGRLDVVSQLLALTGSRQVDVWAGGQYSGWHAALKFHRDAVLTLLVSLPGDRLFPCGECPDGEVERFIRARRGDALWGGTCHRRARRDVLLLRSSLR